MAASYKKSKYLVEQDVYQDSCVKKVLFSTRTANLISIHKDQFEQILTTNGVQEIDQETLHYLLQHRFIVDKNENELETILEENQTLIKNSSDFYMAIQPSAACPLGCGYCGQAHSSKHLSKENQNHLLQHIEQKLLSSKYKTLSITWFGGEPLSGYSVIKSLAPKIIKLAQRFSLPYTSSMTTNGLLLDKETFSQLCNEYKLNHFEITLDGTAEYHDKRRHLKNGQDSFAKIYQNLVDLLNMKPQSVRITIRCNVDWRNRDGVLPLIQQLAKNGLHKKVAYFYAVPIHSWGNDAHLLSAEKKTFAQWEIEWLIEMQELGFNVQYLPGRKRDFCIAVMPDQELVDPFGNLFSCTETSLVPVYEQSGQNIHSMGRIGSEIREDHPKRTPFGEFFKKAELKKYDCYDCSLLPVCGGGCPKEWAENRKPCPPLLDNIKERILLHLAYHSLNKNKETRQDTEVINGQISRKC